MQIKNLLPRYRFGILAILATGLSQIAPFTLRGQSAAVQSVATHPKIAGTGSMGTTKYQATVQDYRKLVFSDEFNRPGAPDSSIWTYDTGSSGWGNHELENYTRGNSSNVYIQQGLLHIVALRDSAAPEGYSSVRMVQRKGFLYGRLEVRAKLPPGRGLWPALWLLPDQFRYGNWPSSGEIDLMENVGYNPDSVFFTVHTEKYNHVKHTQKSKGIYTGTLYSQFHIYALEWNPDSLQFFMDNKKIFSFKNERQDYKSWPYDQPFHLLMNIAVGGDWGGKKGIDNNAFPATMLIDYVRVYQ